MEFRGAPVPARWSPARFGASVGLCPSRDALEGLLTPREHLAFAARVHRQTISSASATAMNAFRAFASAEDRGATEGCSAKPAGAPRAQHAGGKSGPRGEEGAWWRWRSWARRSRPRRGSRDGDGSDPALAESRGPPEDHVPPEIARICDATRDVERCFARRARADDGGVGDADHVAEASAVADRIAVMSHGRVKCCLPDSRSRKLLERGYRLHVTLADGDERRPPGDRDARTPRWTAMQTLTRTRSRAIPSALLDAVRRRVPDGRDRRAEDDHVGRVSRTSTSSTSSTSSRSVVVSLARRDRRAGRIGALLAAPRMPPIARRSRRGRARGPTPRAFLASLNDRSGRSSSSASSTATTTTTRA